MNKRTLIVLLTLISMSLIFVFSPASAQTDMNTVEIHPLRWNPDQTVYSNQEIIFVMGWGSCHKGLVRSFLTGVNMTFILDGEALFTSMEDTNQYWGPIHEVAAPSPAVACLGKPLETIWRTDWAYSYGSLAAGDHTLYFKYWVDHPLTDAADYDGDGKPDIFKEISREREFTIHVEDP